MKINSIGNGNRETKQHLLSLPNKSKKINSKESLKNKNHGTQSKFQQQNRTLFIL